MKETAQMLIVLTLITTVCGLALSGIKDMTETRIENQILQNVQGPRVKEVLEGAENDLIGDRKKIELDDREVTLFVGKKDQRDWAVAYETTGRGFGGDITVMVGYDLEKDQLTGVRVISHKETPGVGSRVEAPQFTKQFDGINIGIDYPADGCPPDVDAVTGATYSSRGVCEAVQKSLRLYPKIKEKAVASR